MNTSTISTSTDHQLKENKHTSDNVIFGPMSSEKPNVENQCSYLEGFIIMQFSEYNQGARNGSPNRECPRQ